MTMQLTYAYDPCFGHPCHIAKHTVTSMTPLHVSFHTTLTGLLYNNRTAKAMSKSTEDFVDDDISRRAASMLDGFH